MNAFSRVSVLLFAVSYCFLAAGAPAEEQAYPEYSPDAKRIAFSADTNGNHDLFVANHDGSNRIAVFARNGTQTQPTWSPNGKEIAFVHRPWNPASQSVLMIVPAHGGQARRIGQFRDVSCPFWGDDGRIYFSMRVAEHFDVFSVLPSGDDLVNHTNTQGLDEGNVHVMRGRMAYDVPDGDHYVIAIQETIDESTRRVFLGNVTHWDPHWLSNGNLLIGVYPSGDATLSKLVEFDPQGNEVKQWTPDGYNVFWPTVAPDEKGVVFSYSNKDFGVGTLHVLDFSSGAIRPLFTD